MSDSNALYLYEVKINHKTHKEENYTYTIAINDSEWDGHNGGLQSLACKQAMDKFLAENEIFENSVIKIVSVDKFKQVKINNIIKELMEDVFIDLVTGNVENSG